MLLSCSFPPVRVGEEDVGWHWCWIYSHLAAQNHWTDAAVGHSLPLLWVRNFSFSPVSCWSATILSNRLRRTSEWWKQRIKFSWSRAAGGGWVGLVGGGGGRRWKEVEGGGSPWDGHNCLVFLLPCDSPWRGALMSRGMMTQRWRPRSPDWLFQWTVQLSTKEAGSRNEGSSQSNSRGV